MTTPQVFVTGGGAANKLGLIKVDVDGIGDRVFSDPGSPDDARSTIDFSASRAVAQRSYSRSSHRSSSYIHHHRSQMSSELTSKAESKFMALMEYMSKASSEASSLREYWSKFQSERESWIREREDLCERISEYTREIEIIKVEKEKHTHEHTGYKKAIAKLEIELAAALLSVSSEKKKCSDHERELERVREVIHERDETISRTKTEYEKVRSEYEELEINFRTVKEERDCARGDAERHEKELSKVIRERTEISSKLVEVTSKYESSRKEVVSINERLKVYEMEREEWLLETDRLRDDARRCKTRAEEASKELFEMTEKYERVTREITKVKETIKTIESERDEYHHSVEVLRRENKSLIISRDDAEERCSDATLKYEHIKRELSSYKERYRVLEIERTEYSEKLETLREQHRLIVIERDELKDEIHHCHRRVDDARREVSSWTEKYKKLEHTLTTVRSEVSTLTERTRHLERERDEARHRCGDLDTEIIDLKQQIVVLKAEIKLTLDARDKYRHEWEKCKAEYESVYESITRTRDGTHDLECEIDDLRIMLREAREQKETAISARNSADRERDEWCTKYEEKCRELERFEEGAAHRHRHGYGHGHGHGYGDGEVRIMERRTQSSNHVSHGHETSE